LAGNSKQLVFQGGGGATGATLSQIPHGLRSKPGRRSGKPPINRLDCDMNQNEKLIFMVLVLTKPLTVISIRDRNAKKNVSAEYCVAGT
jgi:hypothetical protein